MVPATEDGGILAYDASLHAEALAFQPQAYPRRRRAWLASRWDWMFLGSASRLHERPAVWFHRTDAGMFGQRGAMLVRLRCGHDSLIAGWLVDTVVLPDVRGRGVGGALVARSEPCRTAAVGNPSPACGAGRW
jgi:GNAT superfamily N-acetyltransferase